MTGLPLWLLLVIFVAAGGVIWIAGIQLSKSTDVLDARLHLGSALGGLIVLAVATNLPEIAITVTAAASGSVQVAVGNILGGIALQTVVIMLLDLLGKRAKGAKPLTYRAASLTLVIEALVVVAVLAVVVAGTQLPKSLDLLRLTPQAVLIAAVWVVGLFLVRRAGKQLPWHENGERTGHHPASLGPPREPLRREDREEHEHGTSGTDLRRRRDRHADRRLPARAERRRGLDEGRALRCALRRDRPRAGDLAAGDLDRPASHPPGRREPRHQRHLRRQRVPAGPVPARRTHLRQGRATPGALLRHLPHRGSPRCSA